MYKIAVFNVREEEIPYIDEWIVDKDVEVGNIDGQLSMDNIHMVEGYDGISTLQNTKVTAEMYPILKGYGIKQIAQRTAGFDNYDLEIASANDIIISNVPSYSPESIAEFSLTAALMIVRKMRMIEAQTDKQDFRWIPPIRAKLVQEMTIGIIGTGLIGRKTAALYKGFGAHVIGYDLYPNDEAKTLLEYRDSIEDIIQEADIVSLHIPATEDNYHQFDLELFKKFKKGAVFINAARGSIVDTEALIHVLDEGWLAGAALDTYENESIYVPEDFRNVKIEDELFVKVLNHDKILYTPHIAYYTDVSVRNMMVTSLDSTLEVLETGTTVNKVN